jgi:hypothetical protein
MVIDFTWNIGVIVQIAVLIVGGIVTLAVLKNTVATIKTEVSAMKTENDKRFDGIQSELKKMGEILIGMARFDERLSSLDSRVTTHGRKLDDLSRGRGFIRGDRATLDGEYEN